MQIFIPPLSGDILKSVQDYTIQQTTFLTATLMLPKTFFLLADLIHIKQENISLQLNFILCEAYGIERVMSRPYHPQTNGLFERTNRTLQERLSKVANESNWDKVSSHFLCTQEKYFIERYRIQFMSIKIFSISKDLDSFPLQKICCSLFGCLYLNYL